MLQTVEQLRMELGAPNLGSITVETVTPQTVGTEIAEAAKAMDIEHNTVTYQARFGDKGVLINHNVKAALESAQKDEAEGKP